jgi:hypothetical protein
MKKQTTRPRYVYRAKYPESGTDGYLAKVVRGDKRLQQLFSLADFDGNHAACQRAAARAAAQFIKANPRLSRRAVAQLPRRKSDRDLPVGVRRVRNKVRGHTYEFFEASWSPEPNRQVKKRFSVGAHGRKKALDLAVAARKSGLRAMND